MSDRVAPHITIGVPSRIGATPPDPAVVPRPPSFAAVRRLMVRRRAARMTEAMLRELLAVPRTTVPREPLFMRFEELSERYAALGGDPADLSR